jgi:hypothetical protein
MKLTVDLKDVAPLINIGEEIMFIPIDQHQMA